MVKVTGVVPGSYAEKCGILPGDTLVLINGNEVRDVLDYRFYICEEKISLTVSSGGKERICKIDKDEYDDIGLEFETFLMDKKHSCKNKCIFCFIDQLPCGMRETLYFKDDDSRLSFLQGNYVTLTNLSDADVDRIIKMHMSPINISVHTTDPELRAKMLHNKRAGEVLKYMRRFADANIEMNCQIVLCKGFNDGDALTNTMHDLACYYPHVASVSVVPFGMTKFRDGLCEIAQFTREESAAVVRQVEDFASKCKDYYGEYIFYCGDEFYIEGGLALPNGEYYGDYKQIENGVGMIASMKDEFDDALASSEYDGGLREISLATGSIAYAFINDLANQIIQKYKNINIHVYKIENDFFGRTVTVSGLVTGRDLAAQLGGKRLGEALYIPSCMLRAEGDLFLCGMSVEELEQKLGVAVVVVENNGYDFVDKILGGN